MSSIENPLELRDPFIAPRAGRAASKNTGTPKRDGIYTNIPVLGRVGLNEIVITGVIIGEERRAFLIDRKRPTQVFTIKEGMRLGRNNAEIKAIMPGGIILVEKVVNIYGDTEYLETVVPISK
jgi:type IV pilus assembly protein PilP